jgi:DNA-binding response OmpR family regulator
MPRPIVLVVDDSRTLRLKLQRMLQAGGYDVVLASCGKEAMLQIRDTRPDVVILDIQMPEMDGYEVCQELQTMGEPWDRVPVIFLTIVESHALNLLGNKLGAYLRKPVAPAALLAAVADCVHPGGGSGPSTSTAVIG